jgi:hypothetical protein
MSNIDWLNRLAKWRAVLAGWQLGTRMKGDPESDAVRDHREATLLLRAEMNALTGLLIKVGIITVQQMHEAMIEEAKLACEDLEKRFPGFSAVDNGMEMDPRKAAETTKGWPP